MPLLHVFLKGSSLLRYQNMVVFGALVTTERWGGKCRSFLYGLFHLHAMLWGRVPPTVLQHHCTFISSRLSLTFLQSLPYIWQLTGGAH